MTRQIHLNKYIDHTNLKPDASDEKIKQLCKQAKEFNFKSVCVHPSKIKLCKQELMGSPVLICTVVGFPLGQNTIISKIAETIDAVNNGADEIDMVINIAELKNHNKFYCIKEINEVVKAASNKVVKVIVETALLNNDEKKFAFEIVNDSLANFIKTSTGFANKGAQPEDVRMWSELRRELNSNLRIKAAGGISTYDDVITFILAGADRIGTSRSVDIFKGEEMVVTIRETIKYTIDNYKPKKELNNNEKKEIEKGLIELSTKQPSNNTNPIEKKDTKEANTKNDKPNQTTNSKVNNKNTNTNNKQPEQSKVKSKQKIKNKK